MTSVLAFVFAAVLGVSAAAQEALTAVAPDESGPAETDMIAVEAGGAAEADVDNEADPGIGPIDGTGVSVADFLWIKRPVVVFADSANDPRFRQQMEFLMSRPEALADRDAIIITDTDPAARSGIRTKLRPRGFMLVLIEKDGTVNLRKPFPWDVREISRAIDKWPLRQQEIRDAGRPGG